MFAVFYIFDNVSTKLNKGINESTIPLKSRVKGLENWTKPVETLSGGFL
jgi:hypothetical protein